ncbi:MAG: hypothetical protein LBH44_02405 [Treponema sp.]|jgi:hypothetical protein|nr:hypothetical protein [Treponema sp.]
MLFYLRMVFARFSFMFALFLLISAIIFARDIEIFVEDEDLAMPLEGAVIALRGGTQFICDEDGIARVSLPDDRQAVITVSYPGYESLRLTIPPAGNIAPVRFTASLRLGGIMTSQELVIEAARPETSETKSGRSVAISERELTRTAEIGIIEDVMNSVRLLPGVGYAGMFSAMPSIRGGDPGDLMAALDGFYLERPYHWLGSVSIFDPKMVSSARLSHGVFSARYGHTISGLLEVTTKSPSSVETEIETAIGTSAASLNLSLPLWGKGGILFMGKVTYWDTLVWAAQGLSRVVDDENLQMINAVTTAPYIRSAALSMNYRITSDMEWRLNGFFGSDGVGADFRNEYDDEEIQGMMEIKADYNNYQGFLIAGLSASPMSTLALRFSGGIGFIELVTEDYVDNNITAHYNEDFVKKYPSLGLTPNDTYNAPNVNVTLDMENTIFNTQLRADADIDLGRGFIAAFGVQELYSLWKQREDIDLFLEIPVQRLPQEYKNKLKSSGKFPILELPDDDYAALLRPSGYKGDVENQGFTTSGYSLLEYASLNQRFGAELGLRVDHLYFHGKDFSVQTMPAFNPRLNIDFGILKNRGNIDSLTATAGTGLFSSMNTLISFIEKNASLEDYDMKLNRSWTSVIGFKIDFVQKYSFNIEGYYKYVFDRAYITADTVSSNVIEPTFNFDGVGNVWGFDLQLQKLESRYWDGWISYTFTWAKYMDPSGGGQGLNMGSTEGVGEFWYYPSFHRFHNCNIVLNFKPLQWFHIAARFGFASGQPKRKVSNIIYPYPVQVIDENGKPQLDDKGDPVIIQKYRRDSWYDENERADWALPLDIKFSFFPANRKGRTGMEIYLAGENLMSIFYVPSGNTTFNSYTGKEDTGGGAGNFDLPIPMVSFGFKWRY